MMYNRRFHRGWISVLLLCIFMCLLTNAAFGDVANESDGEAGAQSSSSVRNLSAGNDTFGLSPEETRLLMTTQYVYRPQPITATREAIIHGRVVQGLGERLSGSVAVSLGVSTTEVTRSVPAIGVSAGDRDRDSGIGDISLGLQYNWLSERGLRPNIGIGAELTIPPDRPDDPSEVVDTSLSSGLYGLDVDFSASKNFSSVSLYGSLGISQRLPRSSRGGVKLEPGSVLRLSGNAAFSVNAYVTFNGGWTLSWSGRDRIGDVVIEGSDEDQLLVNTGVTLRVASRTYVRQSIDVGVVGHDVAVLGVTVVHLQ